MWNERIWKRRNSSAVAFFLAGVGTGGALALLFAPQSGKESQEWIAEKAREGVNQVKAKGQELREQAQEWIDRGKQRSVDAVQTGKDAYRQAAEKSVIDNG